MSDFTKSNLQLGQILELRNGTMYVNAGVQWLSNKGWTSPDNYSTNLQFYNFKSSDVMKVYQLMPKGVVGFSLDDGNDTNAKANSKTNLKLVWERVEIKYEEIEFITALRLMKNNEEVFVSYYGKSIDDYNEIIMKIELKSIEVIKFKECSVEISEGEHFKLTSIEDKPSVYTEKISNMVNGIFYRVN